eukprot:scaffold24757_cov122-Cylindrotheca_fusiformis.AAC.3
MQHKSIRQSNNVGLKDMWDMMLAGFGNLRALDGTLQTETLCKHFVHCMAWRKVNEVYSNNLNNCRQVTEDIARIPSKRCGMHGSFAKYIIGPDPEG